VVEARVPDAEALIGLRLYFRADVQGELYFLEMRREGDRFRAWLPGPAPGTRGLVYYLQTAGASSENARTEPFHPAVVLDPDACRGPHRDSFPKNELLEATFSASGPGSAFPPGFLADGLRPERNERGAVQTSSSTTSSVLGGATTTVSTTSSSRTTTVPMASGLEACFETEPMPPILPVGGSVLFDAACSRAGRDPIASYLWSFNDGGARAEGPVVSRVYNQVGIFPAELAVTDVAGNESRVRVDVRVEDVPRPAPAPGRAPGASTTVPGAADLAITGISPVPNVPAGAGAVYTIHFGNDGPDADPSVSLVALFEKATEGAPPAAVDAPGCSSASERGALVVTCALGAMGPGVADARVLTVSYPVPDTYFVTVTIAGGTADPVPRNNRASLATTVSDLIPDGGY
jgi:hypothetical protein